jgi:hypothetical protein
MKISKKITVSIFKKSMEKKHILAPTYSKIKIFSKFKK